MSAHRDHPSDGYTYEGCPGCHPEDGAAVSDALTILDAALASQADDPSEQDDLARGFMAFMGGVLVNHDPETRKRLLDRAEQYEAALRHAGQADDPSGPDDSKSGVAAFLTAPWDDPSGPDVGIPCGACYHRKHSEGRQCAVPAGDGFPCQCYFPIIEAAIRAESGRVQR